MVAVAFDVDGTLCTPSPAHILAMGEAIASYTATSDPFDYTTSTPTLAGTSLAGRTDADILTAALVAANTCGVRHRGRTLDQHLGSLCELTTESYLLRLEQGDSPGTILPGVIDLLDALANSGAALGLVTGLSESICAAKLEQLGLWDRFAFGGFGGQIVARVELFRAARADAASLGIPTDRLAYVGATAAGIEAARAAGVPPLAVDQQTTLSLQPTVIVEDLTDTDSVLAELIDMAYRGTMTGIGSL